jgi:hypothetical protein
MDAADFDALVRSWNHRSRRAGLRWLTGGAAIVALGRFGWTDTGAKNKDKKKKRPKKKTPSDDPCADGCPEGFYCCTTGTNNPVATNRCCPVELSLCCQYGCCDGRNPYMTCGPDANSPCLLDI